MRTFKSPYLDENVMLHAPAIFSDYTLHPGDVGRQLHSVLTEVQREAGHPYPGENGIPESALMDREDSYWQTDEGSDAVAELYDSLDEYAPPYSYVGSNEGDGACIGVFPMPDLLHEDFDEDLIVEDSGELPEGHSGLWVQVSDHGNVSLWHRNEQGNDTELWAVV